MYIQDTRLHITAYKTTLNVDRKNELTTRYPKAECDSRVGAVFEV